MKTLYSILNWIFGILFLLIGVLVTTTSFLAGLCFIAISLLLLPPVRTFVYLKTNKEIPVGARAIAITILFFGSGLISQQAQNELGRDYISIAEQEQANTIAKAQQANIEYFNQNKEYILVQAKAALEQKNYKSVISENSKYLVAGDQQLSQIINDAKAGQIKSELNEKTETILSELQNIPTSEFEQNQKLYQQLVDLHPDEKKYKDKLTYYVSQIEKAKIRIERIEAQFSGWDGSHNNLEKLIKKAMNDPDSYEHDETIYVDMGDHLIVQTNYRGKNAFGGVVKNFVRAKVTLDGQILQILDES